MTLDRYINYTSRRYYDAAVEKNNEFSACWYPQKQQVTGKKMENLHANPIKSYILYSNMFIYEKTGRNSRDLKWSKEHAEHATIDETCDWYFSVTTEIMHNNCLYHYTSSCSRYSIQISMCIQSVDSSW